MDSSSPYIEIIDEVVVGLSRVLQYTSECFQTVLHISLLSMGWQQ